MLLPLLHCCHHCTGIVAIVALALSPASRWRLCMRSAGIIALVTMEPTPSFCWLCCCHCRCCAGVVALVTPVSPPASRGRLCWHCAGFVALVCSRTPSNHAWRCHCAGHPLMQHCHCRVDCRVLPSFPFPLYLIGSLPCPPLLLPLPPPSLASPPLLQLLMSSKNNMFLPTFPRPCWSWTSCCYRWLRHHSGALSYSCCACGCGTLKRNLR